MSILLCSESKCLCNLLHMPIQLTSVEFKTVTTFDNVTNFRFTNTCILEIFLQPEADMLSDDLRFNVHWPQFNNMME